MLSKRSSLEYYLTSEFETINKSRDLIYSLQEEMSKHNFLPGAVVSIVNGSSVLSSLTKEEIFWFCDSLNTMSMSNKEIDKIILEEYFSKKEITDWKESKLEHSDSDIYPIVFENVMQMSEDHWVCVVGVDKIVELYKKQIINYNKNTQRQLKTVSRGKDVILQINVNKRSVREIKEELANGTFVSNFISLNISVDNDENEFEYDEDTCTLELISGQMDIIDGYHRYLALIESKMNDDDFDINFGLNIMNFTERKAMHFISQEDKRTPILKKHVRSMDVCQNTRQIVAMLNSDDDFVLCGKVSRYNKVGFDYMTFVLAIDACFKSIDRKDVRSVAEQIKNVFNSYVEDNFSLSFKEIVCLVCASSITEVSRNTDRINIVDLVKNIPDERFSRKSITKTLLNYCVKHLLERGENNE